MNNDGGSRAESAPVELTDDVAAGAAEQLARLEEALAQLKDRHLFLQAEMDNARKRRQREVQEMQKFAAVPVVESLLPVLDHLELALNPEHDRSTKDWGDGIALIARQFAESLRMNGVETIIPSPGDAFDTSRHEAVAHTPSGDVKADHVVAIVRKGFKIHDRLIRPAQVVLAARPDEPPAK